MSGALTWACTTGGSPHRHFPEQGQCGWPSPCGCYDYKMHLSNNYHGACKRQGLLLTSLAGCEVCLKQHSEVPSKRECKHGVLLLLGLKVGCLRFQWFTIGEFKIWVGIRVKEGKSKQSSGQLSKAIRAF